MNTFLKGAALLAVLLSSFSITSIAAPDKDDTKRAIIVSRLNLIKANPIKHVMVLNKVCSAKAELCAADKANIKADFKDVVSKLSSADLDKLNSITEDESEK